MYFVLCEITCECEWLASYEYRYSWSVFNRNVGHIHFGMGLWVKSAYGANFVWLRKVLDVIDQEIYGISYA